ncbi:hypothetical protein AVEN_208151-1 [Araneus ventricosus]|uniref:Uncharacterized protein n=1 Tax=Araneus ventricosus TaxID=182803 RepID=A0A4Y2L7X7_ARAVE|nr:hypothetical protein AVEN_208151-1 [Araneus ventricosus]
MVIHFPESLKPLCPHAYCESGVAINFLLGLASQASVTTDIPNASFRFSLEELDHLDIAGCHADHLLNFTNNNRDKKIGLDEKVKIQCLYLQNFLTLVLTITEYSELCMIF